MMIRKKIKAVYSVHIDFKYEEQERRPLKAGYSYYFQNDKKVAYKDVVDEVVQIINNDLKRECQKYVSHSIKNIEVQDVYEGSIEILFSVILETLGFVGNLMSLYDIIKLIRNLTEHYMNKRLREKYGDHFEVRAHVVVPDYDFWKYEIRERKYPVNDERESRDAFFYYLLIANIVLLILVAVLVSGAVRAVYFL